MGPATKPDQKRRLGFLTGLRLCEAIEREFPELSPMESHQNSRYRTW